MPNDPLLYVNGDFKPPSQATISILDQGFLLDDGVFDIVSAWKGNIFKLDEHLDRFFQSLRAARLANPMMREQGSEAIIETVRPNGMHDASILFILTRGIAKQVVTDPRDYDPTVIIWAAPYVFLTDKQKRTTGIRLSISHLRSFTADTLDPRYKCPDRLHFQLARIEALEAGYDDVIWLSNDGYVSEGPASNIFMVSKGTLYTPVRDVLHGITRQIFLDLARATAIPAIERDLTAFDLYSADEVFTCSTAGGALAVREVSGRPLQSATPGPVTQQLDSSYWRFCESGAHGTRIYS